MEIIFPAQRQARGRAAPEGQRTGLHDPAPWLLHGGLAESPVGFDPANAKAQVYGSARTPQLDLYPDVAEFAVRSLDKPEKHDATLALGGPEALSQLQIVRIFEEVGGRRFEVQHVPVEALEAQQRAATDPMQQSFLGLCAATRPAIPLICSRR